MAGDWRQQKGHGCFKYLCNSSIVSEEIQQGVDGTLVNQLGVSQLYFQDQEYVTSKDLDAMGSYWESLGCWDVPELLVIWLNPQGKVAVIKFHLVLLKKEIVDISVSLIKLEYSKVLKHCSYWCFIEFFEVCFRIDGSEINRKASKLFCSFFLGGTFKVGKTIIIQKLLITFLCPEV